MPSFGTIATRIGQFAGGAIIGKKAEEERLRNERIQALSLALQSGTAGVDLRGQEDLFMTQGNRGGAEIFQRGTEAGLAQFNAAQEDRTFARNLDLRRFGLEEDKLGIARDQLDLSRAELDANNAYRAAQTALGWGQISLSRAELEANNAYRYDALQQESDLTKLKYAVDLSVADRNFQSDEFIASLGLEKDLMLKGDDLFKIQEADMPNLAGFAAGFDADVFKSDGTIDPDYLPGIMDLQNQITTAFIQAGGTTAQDYAAVRNYVLSVMQLGPDGFFYPVAPETTPTE